MWSRIRSCWHIAGTKLKCGICKKNGGIPNNSTVWDQCEIHNKVHGKCHDKVRSDECTINEPIRRYGL